MRNTLKVTLIFALAYFLLQLPGTWLVFSWRSFGGGDHLNFPQRVLEVFIRFPASVLELEEFPLWAMLANTVFWTLVFAAILRLIGMLKGGRR